MRDGLLRVYHALPAPLRSRAASLRGSYLCRWRYGDDTEALIQEALDREQWTPSQWASWRDERLAHILHRAATSVPYYRQQWEDRRRRGDRRSWEYLENWPILEKTTLREHGRSFVADDHDIRRMFHECTSGTTGGPLHVWWSLKAVRTWYALYEARCRRWYDVSRHERWAMLGGQLVVPVTQQAPPFWIWNAPMNQLYMSTYHLSRSNLPSYLAALREYGVTHLCGYPSALASLASEASRQDAGDLDVRAVITNAEPLLESQRRLMTEGFRANVCETYGMAEIVTCASQCREGSLHTWPEIGITEILVTPDLPGGAPGSIVGTSLLNDGMPLIRYRVGDEGSLRHSEVDCGCGRTLPVLDRIEGRSDDLLYTTDGRAVGRLDPVFKADVAVREAQIIQESLARVRVRLVPELAFNARAERLIAARLRSRLGDVEVVLERLAEIPRTSRGKFRAVVCALPPEDRHKVTALSKE